ncbi:MAG TPA: penicillin-binding transpeptidase domain-containing protein [Tepidisphaeraceae bacterium]|nr:penicillin-binding transpeptidase domain-containing protein [Tepidisphaeraceae bacterium]
MFERRLKIFLSILLLVTGVMVLRAMQLQVFGRDHWQRQAVESMKRPRLIETTRGRIIDAKGKIIALDEACIDAAVDFRAILSPPDADWLRGQAIARVRRDLGDSYWKVSTDERKERILKQTAAVRDDLGGMWRVLAEELARKENGGADPSPRQLAVALERIEETRRSIVERVQMRRRYVWYHKYRQAVEEKKDERSPWYAKWIMGEQAGDGPDVDNFMEDVGEQEAPHAILHKIDNDVLIRLKKSRHKYPGLAFIDSADRYYPYENVASHVLGRLSKVMREDMLGDPNLGRDELREYQPNDLIGRMGLEALCEPALRGTRGQVVRVAGEQTEISRVESAPGTDVRTMIDIDLQQQIERLFTKVTLKEHDKSLATQEMHGAAVVIDVPTGAVRVLASWPNYNANEFDVKYAELARDEFNQPLLNRATQWAIEPGSTVKPIVGLGAITDGLCSAGEGIECTGYLTIRRTTLKTSHRCWVASMFAAQYPDAVAHHQIPTQAPHRGHSGNPNGFLTFSDALERSCNIYFQNLADEMGVAGLVKWFQRFGLGRPTGIGIAESRGWLISAEGMNRRHVLGDTWYAGIGQGQVGATTIQMANAAATIARDGVWLRPHLVDPGTPTTRPAALLPDGPDRVDLKLAPAAILAAKKGMVDVVYAPGGTADNIMHAPVRVAGKTGSAQAATLRTPIRDERGNLTYECAKCQAPIESIEQAKCIVCESERRRIRRTSHMPSSPQQPNPAVPWYRGFGEDGKTISHAWFIGYAPAENPRIAFAVMVEYGGSGGFAATGVAKGVIEACVQHGYLQADAAAPKLESATP